MGRHPTANVRCPRCGYAYSRQYTSVAVPDGYRRVRKCLSRECGRGFTTYEVHAKDMNVLRSIKKWMNEDDQASTKEEEGISQEATRHDERAVSKVRLPQPGAKDHAR
jgi:transcriptional regulator NrdR family protein